MKHDPVTVQVFWGILWWGMTQLHIKSKDQRGLLSHAHASQCKTYVQQLYGDDENKVLLQEDGSPALTSKASSDWVNQNWPGQVFIPIQGRHMQLIDSFSQRVQEMGDLEVKHCGYLISIISEKDKNNFVLTWTKFVKQPEKNT